MGDIGGLGSHEGPPVVYHWTAHTYQALSTGPGILPWIALLLLLLPKQNRSARIFWLAVPIGVCLLARSFLVTSLPFMSNKQSGMIAGTLDGGLLALAAVWLVSPYLRKPTRFLTFAATLGVIELFALYTWASWQNWIDGDIAWEPGYVAVGWGLITSAALTLAGMTRNQSLGIGPIISLTVWILAGWTVCFLVIGATGVVPLPDEPVLAFLIAVSATFGLIVPFMLLSMASPYFRNRFCWCLTSPVA